MPAVAPRQSGFPVTADTTVRLWHVGGYRYGWEDAGGGAERYADYPFHLAGPPAPPVPGILQPVIPSPAEVVTPPGGGFSQDWFTCNVPVWQLSPFR